MQTPPRVQLRIRTTQRDYQLALATSEHCADFVEPEWAGRYTPAYLDIFRFSRSSRSKYGDFGA